MASIILSGVAGSVGNALLPGIGGSLMSYAARKIGNTIDTSLGLSSSGSSSSNGPTLENISVQDSRYGNGIPKIFGTVRVAGNVIWASDLCATAHGSSSGGMKGGALSSSSSSTTYTYSVHAAIALGYGEIGGIQTIWADSKVIYEDGVWKDGVVGSSTFYRGTMDQEPDPLMQSAIGSSALPAYRGIAYIVLESLQLANFSNRLPSLTFEVLPSTAMDKPYWLGETSSNVFATNASLTAGGMNPIVLDGSTTRARKIAVGGLMNAATSKSFVVVRYDVTNDAPLEEGRALSPSFDLANVTDFSWALSLDGRFIACLASANGSGVTECRVALYDTETSLWGDVLSFQGGLAGAQKQMAWIDQNHFLFENVVGSHRGVEVFARSGLSAVDCGFHDVWGAGSSSSRASLFYTQFAQRSSGGLYAFCFDQVPLFSAFYARSLVWRNGTLSVGAENVVSSGTRPSNVGGLYAFLLETDENELTLFLSTTIAMMAMSFRPSDNAIEIVRDWTTLSNTDTSYTSLSVPMVFGNKIVIVQSYGDSYYSVGEIALKTSGFELLSTGAKVLPDENGMDAFSAYRIDGVRFLVFVIGGAYNKLATLGIVRRMKTGSTLDAVVGNLLSSAGYAASDYDVSALSASEIDGFVIDGPMTAAAALEPLKAFEPFDLIESDAQLKAVLRNATQLVAIADTELRASASETSAPSLQETRIQELDLPVQVTLDYMDPSRDYETGTQRARRNATRGAAEVVKLSLPIVCSGSKGKQMAEARLFTAWAERDEASITLSRSWACLDPGDVVGLSHRLFRVTNVESDGLVWQVGGVFVPKLAVTSAASADTVAIRATETFQAVRSSLYLMDLPLLRLSDDQPGFYACVSGASGWIGASLWRTTDETNAVSVAGFSNVATAGCATSALASASCETYDRVSSVTVQLLQGELSSCSDEALLGGANAALLGDEIIQFQKAVLIGPCCYTLSGLLRGRCGTDAFVSTHVLGERFVLIDEKTFRFIPVPFADRGNAASYTALSTGRAFSAGTTENIAYAFATLKPLAPVHVGGVWSSGRGSDLTLTWNRRARKNAAWVDYIDVPFDEDQELYDVEILNGTQVVRTLSGLSSASVVYSAAQQATDWGASLPSVLQVAVYQVSSRYGRGTAGTASF